MPSTVIYVLLVLMIYSHNNPVILMLGPNVLHVLLLVLHAHHPTVSDDL